MKSVEIFTDGACSGNPGPGGWGTILRFNGTTKELSGGEPVTTNNRMELMAAISGLNALKEPCTVDLYTDSKYVMDGISKWIHGWKKNGWKTADKKPVKNGELWQGLDEANRRHKVTWHWVKGHAGHVENERADELARLGMAPFKPQKKTSGFAKFIKKTDAASTKPDTSHKADANQAPAGKPALKKARRSNQSY